MVELVPNYDADVTYLCDVDVFSSFARGTIAQ